MMLHAFFLAAAISLNGSWDFRFEEGKPCPEVKGPAFEATDRMTVPGCFDAMPKWYMKRGTGFYRRTVTLDRAVGRSWLVIDGLGLYGRFWVDGREIGKDDLPWSRVELPVGALSAGEHEIVAAVDNRFDWSYQKLVRTYYDFRFWGGFFHGLSLSFDNRRLFVRTRDYRIGEVELELVGGEVYGEQKLVFDGKNAVRAEFRNERAKVRVPDFRLWSPEEPNLHTVALEDPQGAVTVRFGIRTIEARNRGIYLNGRRIFLKGANRHDQWLQLGASTPEGIMLADIQNLKKMGGNFFRGAHYPQSQRFLDLCDECGVMVWEESLGWGNGQMYTKQGEVNELEDPGFIDKQVEQTRLMVRNSFNHPSVIIFAFLNEQNSSLKSAKSLTDKLIDTIHAEDSGRLVTFACNVIDRDICHENTDIVAFNTYPGTINGYPGTQSELRDKIFNMKGHGIHWAAEHFRRKYPNKTIIISEIGASAFYGEFDPDSPNGSEEFQDEHNRDVAEAAYSCPDIAGLAYWQFFDTRTCGRECFRDGKKLLAMSRAGMFTWFRKPKRTVGTITDWFTNRKPVNLNPTNDVPWVTDEERKFVCGGPKRIDFIHGDPEDDAIRFYSNATDYVSFNYDESKAGVLGVDYTLEDPLAFADGRKVATSSDWPARRREILDFYEREIYGRMPPKPDEMVVDCIRDHKSAKFSNCRERRYRTWFRKDRSGPCIDWVVFLPEKAARRCPVILQLNYVGNDRIAEGKSIHFELPIRQIVDRGYAFMSAQYQQITSDDITGKAETIYNGVCELWGKREANAPDNPGTLIIWAWGLCRGLDLAERLPEVDAKRSVVTGSSRLGKAALIAAAFDERFAVCVPNQTGKIGVELLKRNYGATLRGQRLSAPHWYCRSVWKYADKPREQPFDQHLLLSCVAPRALLLECYHKRWFDPKGEFLAAQAASPVWMFLTGSTLEASERPQPLDAQYAKPPFGYVTRKGCHGLSPDDWNWLLDFSDACFR